MVNPNRSNAAKKQWREGYIREAVKNRNNEAYRTDAHRDMQRDAALKLWTPDKRQQMSELKKEQFKDKEFYDRWYKANLIATRGEQRRARVSESLKEYKEFERNKKQG